MGYEVEEVSEPTNVFQFSIGDAGGRSPQAPSPRPSFQFSIGDAQYDGATVNGILVVESRFQFSIGDAPSCLSRRTISPSGL